MKLSGTSMATPIVAGAAALLLQAKPSLTPNMVKAILMYTAQPLAGANMLEQGAGELNIEGAVRLANCFRTTSATARRWLAFDLEYSTTLINSGGQVHWGKGSLPGTRTSPAAI